MSRPFRQTVYSQPLIWTGAVMAVVGAAFLLAFAAQLRALGSVASPEVESTLTLFGWGGLAELLSGFARGPLAFLNQTKGPLPGPVWMLWVGGAGWLVGWVVLALGIQRNPDPELAEPPGIPMSRVDRYALLTLALLGLAIIAEVVIALFVPPGPLASIARWLVIGVWIVFGVLMLVAGYRAVREGRRSPPQQPENPLGAPLNPQLARYVDFYWGTLAAYGGGIFFAEVAVVLVHTVLAGRIGVPPPYAIAIAGLIGMGIAFLAGFIGAANARRLSMPEATIALFYLGLPVPLFLMLRHYVPALQISVGEFLREITYVAGLIGRPEISYWLGFALLVLLMVLGITTGFVMTGSGRVDPRTGFELFVARRHVHVFKPKFLLGTFGVLMLGIIPPLLILAMIRAAEAAVERTRIKGLGLRNPLNASEALNAAKLKEGTPTSMMTALSVGGVGVGVMALIIVLSVMSGFEDDLQRKILGTNAHGVVLKYGTDTFTDPGKVMQEIKKVPGVTGETPFILNEVMISSEDQISGAVIKGIDPATVGSVTDLPRNIDPGGSIDYLAHPEKILEAQQRLNKGGTGALDEKPATGAHGADESGRGSDQKSGDDYDDLILGGIDRTPPSEKQKGPVLPGIVVGRELAHSMHVVVGDRINVVSPLGGELGPQGPMPKSRPFRVAGIFYSGMYEYDSKFVYISIDAAKEFFGLKGVSGIEIKVRDIDDARRIMNEIQDVLGGYPFHTRDWGEMNKNLFSALRLEKLVMGIILSIIVIVAAGLIVATVIMLVLEKRKEIAVLKALGVPDGGIVKIFLAEGLQIGVAGGLLGLVSGLGWCYAIEKIGIKLDPEVYYIPNLPVKIEPLQVAIPVVIAVLVTYLASIYPALKASRVEPVEGLKAE